MIGGHDAVILAAGGSLRLGRPKQLLTVAGETLVARASRIVAATRPGKTVAVLGAHAERMCGALAGAMAVFNPDWATGMASSLRVAADALAGRTGPVLVVVIDQLALDEAHLWRLLAAHDGSRDTVTAYADAMGVPAVLRAATLMRAAALEGDMGFRALWKDTMPQAIRADAFAQDLDTEADLAHAVASGRIDRDPR
ncbi:molybdenum cofactor cytidylyltransferase [Luteibacter sp. OK325]|uniref:nucleotidyltransferase family protein n=1 Tax=Luteibacter sp. OK325 TaxID=2135670 RepID=UPI000D4D4BFC|nr:nucleotidyltransferase family protein [Luteibacter sp. OK325]PTR28535.1 molybdenum cofactor cytidylyltransferase [Luteibacter sp. OK325]